MTNLFVGDRVCVPIITMQRPDVEPITFYKVAVAGDSTIEVEYNYGDRSWSIRAILEGAFFRASDLTRSDVEGVVNTLYHAYPDVVDEIELLMDKIERN